MTAFLFYCCYSSIDEHWSVCCYHDTIIITYCDWHVLIIMWYNCMLLIECDPFVACDFDVFCDDSSDRFSVDGHWLFPHGPEFDSWINERKLRISWLISPRNKKNEWNKMRSQRNLMTLQSIFIVLNLLLINPWIDCTLYWNIIHPLCSRLCLYEGDAHT